MKKYIKTIGRGVLCVGMAFFNTAFMTQNSLPPTPDEGAGENEQGNTGQKICNSLPPTPEYPVRVIKAQNSLPPTPDHAVRGICNSLPPTPEYPVRVIKAQNSLPPTPDHAVRGICNSLPPTPERNRIARQRISSPLCFYLMQQRQHTRV